MEELFSCQPEEEGGEEQMGRELCHHHLIGGLLSLTFYSLALTAGSFNTSMGLTRF